MTPTDRFFEAFEKLKELGATNKAQTCRAVGIDCRNFDKQMADHSRQILKPEWLGAMVKKYNVSARWLLTGEGWMFQRED